MQGCDFYPYSVQFLYFYIVLIIHDARTATTATAKGELLCDTWIHMQNECFILAVQMLARVIPLLVVFVFFNLTGLCAKNMPIKILIASKQIYLLPL